MFLQYAERLPIGLEKVIRTVSSETVKRFYQKWYHLQNMAVIAVGDFHDTKVCTCYKYSPVLVNIQMLIKILNSISLYVPLSPCLQRVWLS